MTIQLSLHLLFDLPTCLACVQQLVDLPKFCGHHNFEFVLRKKTEPQNLLQFPLGDFNDACRTKHVCSTKHQSILSVSTMYISLHSRLACLQIFAKLK